MSDERDDVRLTARSSDQAEALMDMGRYEQAIPLLTKSLAESPDDDALHCRLADAYYSLGNYRKAEDFAKTALHLNPNSDHAHFRLAWSYLHSHQFDLGHEHALAAIAIDPDDASNLYTLAWAEYHQGQYKKALLAAERAIELNPDNADLHELMADMLFNMDRKKQAEKHYREALSHDPDSASIHHYLGECLASQHKIYEASEHMLAAVKIQPGEEHYRKSLFNLVHHDLMAMPLQSRDVALAKLDPAVKFFYEDQLVKGGKFENLRLGSIVTMWLLILSLLMLFFTWITGEDIGKLTMFVFVVATVYAALFIMNLMLKIISIRKNNNR